MFDNIQPSDDGIYQCRSDPFNASFPSKFDFRLRVTKPIPPKRTISNNMNDTEMVVAMSSELTLDCSADGLPAPNISWFKDGEPLPVRSQSSNQSILNRLVSLRGAQQGNHELDNQ